MLTEKGLWTRLRTRLIFTGPTLFAFATVMIIPFLYGIYFDVYELGWHCHRSKLCWLG